MIRLKNKTEFSKITNLSDPVKKSVERILTVIEKSDETCNQEITFLFIEDWEDANFLRQKIFGERKASLDFIHTVSGDQENSYYCMFIRMAERSERFIIYALCEYITQLENDFSNHSLKL